MRSLLRRAAVTGVVLAAAFTASPASAAPDKVVGTLSIQDVGSSGILSFAWGISNPPNTGSGGAGSGKVTLSNFTLTKRINPLSSKLIQATATGSHFPDVVISVPIGGRMSPFAVEYKLHQVFVSSVQQSGSADSTIESVSLAYGAFQQTIGTSSRFGWTNDG